MITVKILDLKKGDKFYLPTVKMFHELFCVHSSQDGIVYYNEVNGQMFFTDADLEVIKYIDKNEKEI